jgi:hypothetical protein
MPAEMPLMEMSRQSSIADWNGCLPSLDAAMSLFF